MLPESEREIYINLTFKSSKTELLEGLDALLNLGLIDEKAVADIARNDLSCLLPERKPKIVTQDSIISLKQPSSTPEVEVIFINENRAGEEKEEPAAEVFINENREEKEEPAAEVFISENREEKEEPEEAVRAELFQSDDLLNILFQVWQSLKDEFSIRWLLFLGVFLVMVSSGVLAATQWQRFPAAGQYLILWSYTLVFWGTTFWAAKQDSLQLTTRTLETIALSLIPLNFWAIDSLNLWNNFVGWLVIAIAAFSLTAIYLIQNQQKQNLPLLLNFLLLSYLHWGWSEPNLALIAVHIGAIGTTFTLSFLVGKNFSENSFQIKLNRGLIIFALAVLLIRAIFISAIPIQELALAIGLCGWLLTKGKKLAKESLEKNLAKIGTILLFIAWLVSIKQPIPWQATLISILAIEYCFRQLQQNWLLRDLLAIFAIGLQTYLLLGYLIPPQLRSSAIANLVSVTNSSAYPEYTLYSMSLFPYLLCCLGMTNWLYRKKKTYLAIFGEWIILIFGIFLTGISFANPIARSLNLFLSTATLFYVSIRRTPTRVTLVYLTHILGIGTIAASIDYWFPNLSTQVWANILIALMAIEWIIFTGKTRNYFQKIWQESCWYFGLALAAISYILLLDRAANFIFLKEATFLSALSWLLVPITLTIVAIRVEAKRKTSLIWLSSGSAIAVQLLTIWQPPAIRLFSLSVANVLMLINTSYGKKLNLAKINIGFALTFILALVWERISLGNLCLLGAIELIILWVSARYLGNKKGTLATIYSKAADCWGYFICISELSIFTLNYVAEISLYFENTYTWQYLAAPILIGSAILYRSQKDRIINIIWLLGLCASATLMLTIWQPTAIKLLAVTVATGLMLVNSRNSQNQELFPIINLGWGIGFVAALFWEEISGGNWYLLGAIAIIILWSFRKYLLGKNGTLTSLYSQAADGWAYFLCIMELSIFTLTQIQGSYFYLETNYTWQYLAAPILIGNAILYRSEKDRIINIIWLLGLCASATLMLTIWQPTAIKLLALNFATGLMLVNSRNSQNQELFPIINLGWGIGFVAALFWEEISGGNWYLLGAIAIIILWSLRKYLLDKNGTLTSLYSQAADGWAYFLCIMELSIFTLTQIQASYFYLETNYTWQYVAAPILIGSAILYRSEKDRIINIIWLICLCASATLMLTIWQPTAIKLFGLAVATDLMLVNSRVSQNVGLATLNIGWAIGLIISLFWGEISLGNWYLLGAIAIIILSGLRRYLIGKNSTLASIYSEAADRWNSVICIAELSILTLNSLPQSRIYLETNYTWQYLAAPILIGSAIAYLYWQKPNNQSIFCVAWAIESAVTGGILIAGGANLEIATANICLALLSLLLTRKKYRLLELSILQFLPIIYVLISIAWRWNYFTAQTGWLTLAAAVITILAASRYMKLDATKNTDIYSYGKIISYLCIAGITFGCYELVIYRMMQSSGGSIADAITILAMVAAAIALFYRLFVWFWRSRDRNTIFQFTLNEITIVAHLHWVLASILKILAGGIAVESDSRLFPLSIAVSFVLAAYALIQGRDKTKKSSSWWVYVGIVEIIATTIYARLVLEQMSIIDPWRVIIVCLVALFIYQLPWQNLGWHPTPWHRTSLVLPAATAIVTVDNISYLSLLAVAVFYGRIAISQKNIRWSYLSLSFLDGAIARFGLENNLTDILFYVSIIGFSLLYIAQFDPILIKPKNKQSRHYLRILGIGIVCFVALIFHQDRGGILPSVISLMVIFAGLGLKVRAFLFVGTITFLLTVFYHLIVLSVTYAFLKWVIGLIAGIILIIIAANFEKRSQQMINLVRNWFKKLEEWQ